LGKLYTISLGDNIGYAILLVPIFYTIYVLVLLFLTSTRNPSIVPNALHQPNPEDIFYFANLLA